MVSSDSTLDSTPHQLSLKIKLLLWLLLAIIMESFVCNAGYFTFDDERYAKREVALPFNEQLQRYAMVVAPQQAAITLSDLNQEISTVLVELWSPQGGTHYVTGSLWLTDDARQKDFAPVTKFYVVPDGVHNSQLMRMDAKGKVHALQLRFDASTITSGAAITRLTLNAAPPFAFSMVRCGLMLAVFWAVCLCLHFKWYALSVDPQQLKSKRGLRITSYFPLIFCLSVLCGCFALCNPYTTNEATFYFTSRGSVQLSPASHTMLLDFPRNVEELTASDAYVQLLDAFNKGQLNLDVPTDPRLEQLHNVFDSTERITSGVEYYFDRAYYNGKYFVYWGLAPLLTVYYPIYLLTGQVPTMVLASFMLGFAAICAMFWALKSLYYLSQVRANLLLWEVGMCGAILVTGVHTHVITATHYNLPYQSTILWLAIAVGAACSLAQVTTRGKQLIYALLFGVAVVMVVMSRPLSLLFVLTLAAPIFFFKLWQLFKAKERWWLPFISCAVPVALGAMIVMVYNYLRFASIFEFGQSYQITGWDITANTPELSWIHLKNVLFYYFWEPLTYSKDFPFVLFSDATYNNQGNVIYEEKRFSVFSLPLFWILFTGWFWFSHQRQDKAANVTPSPAPLSSSTSQGVTLTDNGLTSLRLKQIILGSTVLAALLVAYLEYFNAGVAIRYTGDITLPLAFVVFWLLIDNIRYEPTRLGQILYGVVLFFAVKTIVIELLLALNDFNGGLCYVMYPDALVYLRRLLDPLVF